MDTIRVGTGATGEALRGLEADFAAVAGRVPADIGLVGQVVADLNTRTGQTGEGLRDLATQIIELSRLTKTDAAANVALLTRLCGDWSIATDRQASANDRLFRTSQATGIGVDALAERVLQFGAPMPALGLEFERSIALLGKWEKEGVNIETVLAGMRMAVANFAKQASTRGKACLRSSNASRRSMTRRACSRPSRSSASVPPTTSSGRSRRVTSTSRGCSAWWRTAATPSSRQRATPTASVRPSAA